jgi:hypothetical protein
MKTRLGGGEEEDVVVAEAARRKHNDMISDGDDLEGN